MSALTWTKHGWENWRIAFLVLEYDDQLRQNEAIETAPASRGPVHSVATVNSREFKMTIHSRLTRLERICRPSDPPAAKEDPETPLSDDEEADRTGEYLWAGFAIDKQYPRPWGRSPSPSAAIRAWDEAAEAAWAAGHRAYHAGLRPLAMAVWLELKPEVLKHRQTHGVWIPMGKPVRADTLTPEEFAQLPLDERVAILREHRPGYWSKHGPPAGSRSRGRRREK